MIPEAPWGPTGPCGPAGPGSPGAPEHPQALSVPAHPEDRWDPADPADPGDPPDPPHRRDLRDLRVRSRPCPPWDPPLRYHPSVLPLRCLPLRQSRRYPPWDRRPGVPLRARRAGVAFRTGDTRDLPWARRDLDPACPRSYRTRRDPSLKGRGRRSADASRPALRPAGTRPADCRSRSIRSSHRSHTTPVAPARRTIDPESSASGWRDRPPCSG